jgi:hypothetical protein
VWPKITARARWARAIARAAPRTPRQLAPSGGRGDDRSYATTSAGAIAAAGASEAGA